MFSSKENEVSIIASRQTLRLADAQNRKRKFILFRNKVCLRKHVYALNIKFKIIGYVVYNHSG